jgi:hypothetical protein
MCEDLSSFSYMHKTYFQFVSSLIYRQSVSPKTTQDELQFTLVDELIQMYVKSEKKLME